MRRRGFLVGISCALLALRAWAQGKLWRIAYLSGASSEANRPWLQAFEQELRALGYRPRQDLFLEIRYLAGRFEQAGKLAGELAAGRPDLFMVYGADAAHAVRKVAGESPIVMANVLDPVASGLVSSLARPGGNITGVADAHGASVTKRLELIRELAPGASRIGVLWRPGQASHPLQLKDLEAVAARLGLSVVALPVRSATDIEEAFATLQRERASAVLALGDSLLTSHMSRIAALALAAKMISAYTIRPFAQAGGLLAYGTDFTEQFRRAAGYVDRILRGAKAADLPVVQPEKFELVINLKTAKAIGVAVPRSVLLRADHVID